MSAVFNARVELDFNKFVSDLKNVENKADNVIKDIEKPIHLSSPNTSKFESGLGKLKGIIGASLGIAVITKGFNEIVEAGSKFQSSMADFSAITGVTGKALDGFGESAKKLALQFGTGVVENIESFKGVLSRLGPDLAKSPEAIAKMGEAINTLSMASGLGATDSMNALTTAMLQYSVDLSDPIAASKEMEKMMNVMAAAAKEGAAEIPSIAMALETSGAMAKTANVSFEELNAGIQVLATRGKTGAEAGNALRNVFIKLSEGRFMPKDAMLGLKAAGVDILKLSDKTLTFQQRLEALKPAMEDDALISKLFGAENVVAGKALLENTTQLGLFTTKLTGTNTAYEQAGIKGQTFEVQMKKLKAELEIGLIGAFQKLTPVLSGITTTFTYLKEHSDSLVPALAAIAAIIVGVLMPSIVSLIITAAPLTGLVLAIAAVGVAVYALAGGFKQSTESKIRDAEATQKLNAKEIENLKTKKDTLQSQIDLAKAFKELASKEKLSADEKARLKTISEQLHKIYPTVTIDTNNYAGSIQGIEKAAGLSSIALNKIEGDMNKLSKRSRELMIDNLNLQRTLITEKFTDAFKPGFGSSMSAYKKFAEGMEQLTPLFKELAYSYDVGINGNIEKTGDKIDDVIKRLGLEKSKETELRNILQEKLDFQKKLAEFYYPTKAPTTPTTGTGKTQAELDADAAAEALRIKNLGKGTGKVKVEKDVSKPKDEFAWDAGKVELGKSLEEQLKMYEDANFKRADEQDKAQEEELNKDKEKSRKKLAQLTEQYAKEDELKRQWGQMSFDFAVNLGEMIGQNQEAIGKKSLIMALNLAEAKLPLIVFETVSSAVSTLGPIAGFIIGGAAVVALVALLEAAKGAVGRFKEGVVNLQGAGTETSDSIMARLSKHETVMPAWWTNISENKEYATWSLANKGASIYDYVANMDMFGKRNDNENTRSSKNRTTNMLIAHQHRFEPFKIKGTDLYSSHKKTTEAEIKTW